MIKIYPNSHRHRANNYKPVSATQTTGLSRLRKALGMFFLAMACCSIGHAANITSTATGGPWNNAASWVGGIPTAADNVTILSTATITVSSAITRTGTTTVASGGNLTVNSTGTLTLGANLTGNLALTGTLATSGAAARTLTGTVTSTGGSITPFATAPLIITGTVTQSSGTLAYSGGNLTLNGGLAVNGGTFTDGGTLSLGASSTLSVSSGATLAVNSASTFSGTNTVNGTLTLGANLTGNLALAGTLATSGAAARTLTGTVTSTGGSITPLAAAPLTITGTVTQSSGTLAYSGGNLTLNSGLDVSGGTFTDGGTLSLGASSTLSVSSGANLAVNSASTFSGTNTINGTLTLGANLTGNLTLVGGTVTTSGSNRTLTGNITSTTGSGTIAPAASTQLYVSGTLTSSGSASDNLTITGSGALSVYDFTLDPNANATISSTGFVTVRHDLYLDNKADLTVNGVIIVKGQFDAQNNGNIKTLGSGAFSAQGTATSKGTGSVQGSLNYCIAADPCASATPASECSPVCVALGGTYGSPGSGTLPITLISFDGAYQPSEQRVKLNWVTAGEINNSYFTVERTVDGRAFEVLITVKGAGNSHERRAYMAYDEQPLPGLNYYRLKQTDFDGQSTYSKLIVAENSETALFGFNVAPNPVNGRQVNLFLRGGGESSVWVSVYASYLGRSVHEGSYLVEAGNKLSLSLPSSLPGGVYWVKLNQGGQVATRKVVVLNQ